MMNLELSGDQRILSVLEGKLGHTMPIPWTKRGEYRISTEKYALASDCDGYCGDCDTGGGGYCIGSDCDCAD